MAEYYLDIETNSQGVKPSPDDEIITIQYQRLNTRTARPEEDLVILKSWESSEKEILTTFYRILQPEKSFAFIPIGMNLNFDFFLLHNRWNRIDIRVSLETLFYTLPYIDVKPIIVLLNEGSFKGARLDKFTGKERSGAVIPELYVKRDYAAIEQYIRNEAKEFIEFYQKLREKIPNALR
jgi:hypothetical protein